MFTDWEILMGAPWGKFDKKSKEIKAKALKDYSDSYNEWKEKRIREGKWLTKRIIWS